MTVIKGVTKVFIINISSSLLKFLISWKINRLRISGESHCCPLPKTGGSANATIL